jgi:hypothetical protein
MKAGHLSRCVCVYIQTPAALVSDARVSDAFVSDAFVCQMLMCQMPS